MNIMALDLTQRLRIHKSDTTKNEDCYGISTNFAVILLNSIPISA